MAAETLIRGRLAAERPDDGVLGEEGGEHTGTGDRHWVVDPLDGTINFLYGFPQWAVSIALQDADGGLVGVVYDPMREELWSGQRGGPPTLNGEPVAPTGADRLDRALVATGFGYDAAVRDVQGAHVARLLSRVRDIRRAGAAALDLAWVAGGRVDAYFERGVKPWDTAAGVLLCELAGLEVRRLEPDPPSEAGVLAAPKALAAELVELVTSVA